MAVLLPVVALAAPETSLKVSSFERQMYTVDSCSNWLQNAKPDEKRDRVLWEYRLSAEAIHKGDWDLAKKTLDDVILVLGGIHANDPSARKARGLFTAESKKNFIGEPYERCAAYFYRGMLYWKDGELDNARACFRSVEFEDGDSEKASYAGDWVLPDYLDGLATIKLGDDGSDAIKRAQEHDIHKGLPPLNPKANVLIFLEAGQGPIKYNTGQYHEQLRFASSSATVKETYRGKKLVSLFVSDLHPSDPPAMKLIAGGQSQTVAAADDLYFQATTRGGRVMDHVLGNKAVFKKATDTIGDVALFTAGNTALASGGHGKGDIAAAAILAGALIFKGISYATTPTADTRCWDDLPQYFGLAVMQLPAGKQNVTIAFLDPSGGIIARKTVAIDVAGGNKDTVVLVNDR